MKRNSLMIGMVVGCLLMVAGAAWSLPGIPNGTVTSGNLVWLQNANCFGSQTLNEAMNSAKNLKSGSCGLTDGSTAGNWRLPTKDELASKYGNRQGFNNIQDSYWLSNGGFASFEGLRIIKVIVININSFLNKKDALPDKRYVLPVRSVQ